MSVAACATIVCTMMGNEMLDLPIIGSTEAFYLNGNDWTAEGQTRAFQGNWCLPFPTPGFRDALRSTHMMDHRLTIA